MMLVVGPIPLSLSRYDTDLLEVIRCSASPGANNTVLSTATAVTNCSGYSWSIGVPVRK